MLLGLSPVRLTRHRVFWVVSLLVDTLQEFSILKVCLIPGHQPSPLEENQYLSGKMSVPPVEKAAQVLRLSS